MLFASSSYAYVFLALDIHFYSHHFSSSFASAASFLAFSSPVSATGNDQIE
jgi:hypothetical protein